MFSIRDPIHGFIRADELEETLIKSRPMQRLRYVRQLGPTYLVFPGAEHSRFSHVLGTMHLAGRLYDALAQKSGGRLEPGERSPARRRVRAAALLHDVGHAPFSHSAEDRFEGGIDHEEMTRRLLGLPEIRDAFDQHGDGIVVDDVWRILAKEGEGPEERLSSEIVTGELDVDKMDYLLRDSLYCGVGYGHYDLERLLDTVEPLEDPDGDAAGRGWRIGLGPGGVHALEALVMARYYMFTQVYFNATSKVLEIHFSEWMKQSGQKWPGDPEVFLTHDDVSVMQKLRRDVREHGDRHAKALVERQRFRLAFETRRHLTTDEHQRFQEFLPCIRDRFGDSVLLDRAGKNPHRLEQSRIYARDGGELQPVVRVSDFIAHLSRINGFRVYAEPQRRGEVHDFIRQQWPAAAE